METAMGPRMKMEMVGNVATSQCAKAKAPTTARQPAGSQNEWQRRRDLASDMLAFVFMSRPQHEISVHLLNMLHAVHARVVCVCVYVHVCVCCGCGCLCCALRLPLRIAYLLCLLLYLHENYTDYEIGL